MDLTYANEIPELRTSTQSMGRPHVDPEVPECCQLETSMPRKRALAGDAVTEDPTSASANDAQRKANVATTTQKILDAIDEEVDALSEIGATGAMCKGAMRKIRDGVASNSTTPGNFPTLTL